LNGGRGQGGGQKLSLLAGCRNFEGLTHHEGVKYSAWESNRKYYYIQRFTDYKGD